jgi:hypothetical protein
MKPYQIILWSTLGVLLGFPILAVLCIWFLSIIGLYEYPARSSSAPPSQNTPSASQPSNTQPDNRPEDLLAKIDGAPGSGETYARLLDSAETKCSENRMKIADMTVKAVEIAREEGNQTNNLDMLNGLNNALQPLESKTNCAEILTAIVLTM